MTNFDDMAKRVQTAFNSKQDTERAVREEKKNAINQRTLSGIEFLNSHVRKIFEAASIAFAKTNMTTEIVNKFELRHPAIDLPALLFRFKSLPRKSDNYVVKGHAVIVSSDGKSFFVGATEYEGDERMPSSHKAATPENCESVIAEAIEKILKLYVEKN